MIMERSGSFAPSKPWYISTDACKLSLSLRSQLVDLLPRHLTAVSAAFEVHIKAC
jgi:hypothetical protein